MEFPSSPDTGVVSVEYLIRTAGNDDERFLTLALPVTGSELVTESFVLAAFKNFVAAVATEIDGNAPSGMVTTVQRTYVGNATVQGSFVY